MQLAEGLKTVRRMCKVKDGTFTYCQGCPLRPIAARGIVTKKECWEMLAEYAEEAEKIIEKWAADNPEPLKVYPTWGEFLHEVGVLSFPGHGDYTIRCCESIPEEMANHLDIEPKIIECKPICGSVMCDDDRP